MTPRLGGTAAVALSALRPIVFAATGCTEDPSTLMVEESVADVTVQVAGMSYTPTSVTIDVGQSVAWHFADRGTYHYYCTLHPQMEGAVVER